MIKIMIPPSSPETPRERSYWLSVKHIKVKANSGFAAAINRKWRQLLR